MKHVRDENKQPYRYHRSRKIATPVMWFTDAEHVELPTPFIHLPEPTSMAGGTMHQYIAVPGPDD